MTIIHRFLHPSLMFIALVSGAATVACDGDGGGSAQGSCQSTCERSVALACPNEGYSDVATCVSQCEDQTAQCSNASIVHTYLDCVENTAMTCGSTSGTATSSECLQEGLAFFACIQGVTSGSPH